MGVAVENFAAHLEKNNMKTTKKSKTTTTCCIQVENQYACHAQLFSKTFPLHHDDVKKPNTKKKTQVIILELQKKKKTPKKISSMIDQKTPKKIQKRKLKIAHFFYNYKLVLTTIFFKPVYLF